VSIRIPYCTGRNWKQAGTAASEPLIVSRYDTAIEPAPEEEPVLTVGAIAEDGRPVALLFDEETRAKVAGWLAPADADKTAELERLRRFASVTDRRHDEIRARLATVDIRDSAEAWDLGMAIIATLDGPLHPDSDTATRGESTPAPAELLAHATAFEVPRPGNLLPLLLQRSYAGGDRWAICDREGRRWDRDDGWMYEGQHLDERTRTDTRFPLAEAWPLAHRIAAGEPPARATEPTGESQ
jgi:hypothetical protein